MTPSAAVRVRLRYTDLETFIERFAPNVTRGGVFLASKSPRAEGEVFLFEVQLANGSVALSGEGKVIWVKAFNPAEPQKPHGMGVQFVQVDAASRATLDRILQVKAIARPAAGGPARATQPHMTLEQRAAGAGAGGANGRARIDTNVDLAAEYGIDDITLRRVIDRNWTLGPRGHDDVEALLKPDPVEPASLAEALAELPRLLDATARHRSGAQRTLETLARSAAERAAASAAAPTNGASNGSGNPATRDPNEITAHETERKPFD